MGTRGRKPVPKVVKMLKGERADRINNAEPTAPAAPVDPPPGLKGPELEAWRDLAPKLSRAGLLTELDVPALIRYCEAFGRYTALRKAIDKHGYVTTTADKGEGTTPALKINPAVPALATAWKDMLSILTEFGCSPTSRSRVKLAGNEKGDPLDEFLNGTG